MSNVIPAGKLTVWDGHPGVGKTTLACEVASHVSTGQPFPGECEQRDPAGVILVLGEDSLTDTIQPRLVAAGADLSRIGWLDAILKGETERSFNLRDLEPLEREIENHSARLVIIDPFMAFLPPDANSYRDQDMRAVLTPLGKLADRAGAAMLLIRHPNKNVTLDPVMRGAGSIGITGAARSVWAVGFDPKDPEVRVLAPVKVNIGLAGPPLAFRIEEAFNGTGRVVWLGTSDVSASELVGFSPKTAGAPVRDEAVEWLRAELSSGPKLATDVEAARREAVGISAPTLRRAKQVLGVESFHRDGYSSAWWWRLPTEDSTG